MWWVLAAIVLIAPALAVLAKAARLRQQSGLPGGPIVSSDTGAEQKGKPLYSTRYGLTGTPDYIVSTRRGPVPVEVKPTRTDSQPHESHLLQVLAYCLLIEDAYGKRPPYGLLRYSTATFKVDYNSKTRAHLLEAIEQMRVTANQEEWQVGRNHQQPARCRACGYRDMCDLSLWSDEQQAGRP
jgi:CRISPR-associated exonuclease Cas4